MTILQPGTEADLIEAVLEELGIEPADATAAQTRVAGRRVAQALAKVLAFLNRENFNVATVTMPELWQDPAYPITDVRAWRPELTFTDRARYVSHIVNADDDTLYDVTFEVGLSLENAEAEPIREVLVAEAAESLQGHALFPTAPAVVKSVSGGGQSMSWETRGATPDAAGGKLTVAVLGRFKRYNVGVSDTTARADFPYGGRLP